MPHIYITDETKAKLDKLVKIETRGISKEVELLATERLNYFDNTTSNVENQDNKTSK